MTTPSPSYFEWVLWYLFLSCLVICLSEPRDERDWLVNYGSITHGFDMSLSYIGRKPLSDIFHLVADRMTADRACDHEFNEEIMIQELLDPQRDRHDPFVEAISAQVMSAWLARVIGIIVNDDVCWFTCRDSRPELPQSAIKNHRSPKRNLYLPQDETKLRGFYYIRCAAGDVLEIRQADYWIGPVGSREYEIIISMFGWAPPKRTTCVCLRPRKSAPSSWSVSVRKRTLGCTETEAAEKSGTKASESKKVYRRKVKSIQVETTDSNFRATEAAFMEIWQIGGGYHQIFGQGHTQTIENPDPDAQYRACGRLADPIDGNIMISEIFE